MIRSVQGQVIMKYSGIGRFNNIGLEIYSIFVLLNFLQYVYWWIVCYNVDILSFISNNSYLFEWWKKSLDSIAFATHWSPLIRLSSSSFNVERGLTKNNLLHCVWLHVTSEILYVQVENSTEISLIFLISCDAV